MALTLYIFRCNTEATQVRTGKKRRFLANRCGSLPKRALFAFRLRQTRNFALQNGTWRADTAVAVCSNRLRAETSPASGRPASIRLRTVRTSFECSGYLRVFLVRWRARIRLPAARAKAHSPVFAKLQL